MFFLKALVISFIFLGCVVQAQVSGKECRKFDNNCLECKDDVIREFMCFPFSPLEAHYVKRCYNYYLLKIFIFFEL